VKAACGVERSRITGAQRRVARLTDLRAHGDELPAVVVPGIRKRGGERADRLLHRREQADEDVLGGAVPGGERDHRPERAHALVTLRVRAARRVLHLEGHRRLVPEPQPEVGVDERRLDVNRERSPPVRHAEADRADRAAGT
jgi:hypothetical protein